MGNFYIALGIFLIAFGVLIILVPELLQFLLALFFVGIGASLLAFGIKLHRFSKRTKNSIIVDRF